MILTCLCHDVALLSRILMLRQPVARGQISKSGVRAHSPAQIGSVLSGYLAAAVRDQLDETKFGQPGEHLVEVRGLLAAGQADDVLATEAVLTGRRQGRP